MYTKMVMMLCYTSRSALALAGLARAGIAAGAGARAAAIVQVNGVLDDGRHSSKDLIWIFGI